MLLPRKYTVHSEMSLAPRDQDRNRREGVQTARPAPTWAQRVEGHEHVGHRGTGRWRIDVEWPFGRARRARIAPPKRWKGILLGSRRFRPRAARFSTEQSAGGDVGLLVAPLERLSSHSSNASRACPATL